MLITISNSYGCGAVAIAHQVAQHLGYLYVDDQLPVVVAKRLRTSARAVQSAENPAATMSERMLRALESGTPEVRSADAPRFDRECLREVQDAVREYAAHGNVVIVGRAANAVLGRRPDLLRVFLHAPRDWCIRRIVEGHGVDEKTAASEVDRINRAREEYVREYYDVRFGDPESYDLSIDTSTFGLERSAALIMQALGER